MEHSSCYREWPDYALGIAEDRGRGLHPSKNWTSLDCT